MVETAVPNIGFVVGDTGVILIDDGFANVADVVKKVADKPITTVIETHDDTDHINGLYTTPNADKLKIIAMEDNWKQQKSEKRGTPLGMFHNVDELLKLDVTGYIGGHSSNVMTKANIKQIRDDIKADYDKEAAMTRSGMSLEDIRKAVGDDKYAPRGGCIAYVDLPWYAYTETKRDMEELKNRGTIK